MARFAKGLKYPIDDYLDCDFYGGDNEGIDNYTSKVVKCRKSHECACGCNTVIEVGQYAMLEKGFMDGEPVSIYTACTCIDKWLDELNWWEDKNAKL